MKKLLLFLSFLVTAILFGNDAFAQVPMISYPGTPFTIALNTAATITPTSTNVTGSFAAATSFSTNGTNFIVVTYDPVSASFLAVDNAGNLDRINATTGAITQLNTTVLSNNTQTSIITDGIGNIYVSDNGNNDVYEFAPAGNTLIRTITGFNTPNGLAVDASNNVYVADSGTDDIYEIPAGVTNTKTILLTGFTNPYGLAINGTDLYVSQNGGTAATRSIIKVAGAISGGTTKATLASGFTNPLNLTLDSFGDLFVADGTLIRMVTTAGTITNTGITGLGTTPTEVDFDAAGNLYIADGGRIKKSLVTYYSINTPLPTGLQFNTSTGVISGTPTVISAAANYIITAHNTTSNVTTTLNIAVAAAAPSLTYTNATLTFGTAATLTPTNTGSPPTTCSAAPTLPAGLTISNTTGVISGTPTVITTGAVPYTITAKNATGTTISTVTITINPAPLTITANSRSKTFGTAITFAGTEFTTSGLVNSNTITNVTLTSSGAAATASVAGSPYSIVPGTPIAGGGGFVASNYTITYVNGSMTVTPAALTITAKNQTKAFGSAFTFAGTEFTTSALQNSDVVNTVTLTSSGSVATASVVGSPYSIVPSAPVGNASFSASNYNITYTNGNMTVTKAPLTITANNQTKVYGATFTFTATAFTTSGLQNSDAVNTVSLASTGSVATASVAGSTYPIIPSAAVGNASFSVNNYTINYASGAMTVTPASLTITGTITKPYGTALSDGAGSTAFTQSGIQNGQTIGSVTIAYGAAAAANTAVGTYTAQATPSSATGGTFTAGNYTITYSAGSIIVTQATLTITAKTQSKTFGSTFTFTGTEYTATGLVSPDAITGLTITSTGSVGTASVAGSPYTIIPSAATGTGLSNYTISYVNSTMTVTKAPLTITANNQTKVYGATFTFTATAFTTSGLQNSDAVNTVTLASTGSVATASVAGSTYPIIPTAAVGNASFSTNNYTITYTNGALTVTPAALTITGSITKTYGTTISGGAGSTAFTSSALQNGQSISSVTIAYGTAAAANTAVGTYTAQATPSAALGITASNYNITYTAGSIVVTQATLTITANNAIKTKGTTLTGGAGSTAFTSSGLVNGETLSSVTIAYGAAAISGAAIGTYPNQVTPSAPVGSATFNTVNYTITYVNGSIIINDIPPVIAYNTPNLYTENVAIPTLGPSNTGGAVPAPGYSTATSLSVTPNLNGPEGMATNAAGNLYVTNSGSGTVDVFNSSGTSIGTFGSGFTKPVGIVFDSAGNAYILDSSTKKVYEYNAAGTLINTITVAGLSNNLTAIAIDASNNLYITDFNNNDVVKFNTSGTVLLTITSNINAPTGIAIDPSGNIYVADSFNLGILGSQLTEYNASGTYLNASHYDLLGNISALAIDGFGNLYYTDDSPIYETLYKYSSTGALINTITGLNAPEGITVDKSGNLYISDINNNTVNKYSLTGGYYLTGVLPPGLSFNNTTGQITGTPTTTFATTSYTVTAFNSGGSATSNIFTLSCVISFDWVGTTSTNWNTTTNWLSQTVPGTSNTALIGVNVNFTNFPTVSTAGTTTVGAIQFGTTANQQAGVAVNTGCTLNVIGAITYQSDAKSFTNNAYVCTISGAGILTAASLNINANTTLAGQSYTEKLASSLTNLQISGNVILTSTNSGASLYNSTFNVIGGVTTLTGVLQSVNSSSSTSTFGVNTTGTLQFANATALSGLSTTGTNVLSFNNAGATIGYTGAAQTVYTDAVIPGLAAGPSYYSIAFSGTGAKTPNAGNLNIAGNFTNALTNDGSNYVTLTGTQVFFNGTTQTLAGGVGETSAFPALTSTGTVLTNVTFSGNGTKTISSGVFHISSNGFVNMSGSNALTVLAVGALGNLTLNSDITGSATVPAFTGPKITGNVDVQRYLSGSTTASTYRGYRLLSSPVATSTTSGIYSLNYVGLSTYITGTDGTLGGFYKAGNPSLYLYRDNLAPSNASFTSGNFRGINNISASPNYTLDGDGGPFNIPVGNGFLFFDRGAITPANPASKFVPGAVAESITLTATGTLNAGQVTVKPWFEPASSNLDYTAVAGNAGIIGFALAGNPYPSSIDWNNYSVSSSGSPIYGPGTNGNIYIMDPVSQNYIVYNPSLPGNTSAQGTPNANIIPSGQGFFVQATSSSAQLIFNESAKTNGQASAANGNLFLGAPPLAAVTPYLRLKLVLDSVHTDGLIILFNNSVKATYDVNKDAKYRQGNGTVSIASMSADSVALAINTTPFPQTTRVIPLKVGATSTGIYHINMTALQSVPELFDIWLKDAYTKDSLDIKHNPQYSFNVHINDPTTFGAGRFTLVIRQNPALGLHLLNFTAAKAINGAQVVWVTENEENYTNFTVERSTDGGVTYQVLGGFVSSDQGTYSFLDKNPADLNQYRLKLEDLNGVVSYSKVVTIMYGSSNTLTKNSMGLYPNPTNSKLNLTIVPAIVSPSGSVIPANSARVYGIKIVNNTGGIIQTATINSTNWQTDVSGLIPGTYIIQVIDNTYNSLVGRSTFIKL